MENYVVVAAAIREFSLFALGTSLGLALLAIIAGAIARNAIKQLSSDLRMEASSLVVEARIPRRAFVAVVFTILGGILGITAAFRLFSPRMWIGLFDPAALGLIERVLTSRCL